MQPSPSKAAQPERLLRLPDVEALTGLKKSSIYVAMRRGEFPQPVKLSRRAVCWPLSTVQGWIAGRIAQGGGRD
jgi:prophage regulatory protein